MNHFSNFNHLHYLDQFLLFNSSDYKVIKEKISHYLCPHQFIVESSKTLNTRLNGFTFGLSALYDLKYSAPVEVIIDKDSKNYFFRITLEGQCQIGVEHDQILQSPGIMTVSHPYMQHKIATNLHCRNIILKLSKSDVETQLLKMLGRSASSPVIFDSGMSCTSEGINSIMETLNYLCHAYYNIDNWDFISESFTYYLIELILLKVPNNYSQQLNVKHQLVLPHYMKQAKRYIQQHLERSITVTSLSDVCGVSVRTLQKGFNHYFNQTPIEYIRNQRLDMIHQQLQTSHSYEKITDIMLRNGINSFGHFSNIYKKRYGCLPSHTLKMNDLNMSEIVS